MVIFFIQKYFAFHEFVYIHCCHFLVLYRFSTNEGWVGTSQLYIIGTSQFMYIALNIYRPRL